MKETKKEQSMIRTRFFLNIIIFILFTILFTYYIYPSFQEVENKKIELWNLAHSLNRIEKKWINFKEFSLARKNTSEIKDSYTKKLLLKTNKTFFEENLVNTWSKDYLNFINNKKEELKSGTKNFDKKQEQVNTILPFYDEQINLDDKYTLTDYRFINYLESIIQTFWLTYKNKIWVWELIYIDPDNLLNPDDDLSSKILYIPIKLNIKWAKIDILNFMHYFEKVGAIDIDSWNIKIYKDRFIKKWNRVLALKWDNLTKNYNIYFHQLADIENIKLNKYIDSSYRFRIKNENFVEFIKRTQANEKLEIEVKLRFYVKWLPDYKIKEYIKNFILNYNDFKKYIDSELKNKKLKKNVITTNYLQKVKSVNSYLFSIEKKVKEIGKKLGNSKKLDVIYNEAIKYNSWMENIKITLNKEKERVE